MGLEVFMRRANSGRGRVCRWCRHKIADGEHSMGIIDVYISGQLVGVHFHEDCWDEMFLQAIQIRNSGKETLKDE